MPRTLVICTLAGLVISAAALGAAVTIGGDDIFHDPHSLGAVKPLIDLATHKEWRWNGGDTLAMDAPINIRYRPQGPRQVSVTGPAEVIQHVRVADGRIATDNNVSRHTGRNVQALVSGVPIRKFVVNGGEELDLGDIHQPDLDLHINGGGDVVGRGQVERLNLTISGPGDAKLGGLSVTEEARVSILGNGDAILAPKGNLRVFIAGNGSLSLTSKPKNIARTIIGGGEMREMDVAEIAAEATRAASEAVNQAMPAITAATRTASAAAAQAAAQAISQSRPAIEAATREAVEAATNPGSGALSVLDNRSIDFGHIEQDRVKVNVLASGSATAEGHVDRLNLAVMGSGNAHLGTLRAERADVMIGGSGTATLAVTGRLKVTILGSGNVRLMTRPAQIEQTILGPGRIISPP